MSVEVLSSPTTPSATKVVGTYHITDSSVRPKRPRSTPANITRPSTHGHLTLNSAGTHYTENGHARIHRPKTAAAVLGITRDCDRVSRLEHESTRRHNLDTHMPVKKTRPPPWQSKIDPPLVPFVVGPGYILSKSKSKFAVTLKDEFFEPPQDEEVKSREGSPTLSSTPRKKSEDHERDNLISTLQERISDLTLFLEEERLNHKQTKQKAEEFLRDKVEELENTRRNAVADKEREWKEELERVRSQMDNEHTNYKTTAEGQISRMKKEIEFLQGAFESYKTSLHQETDEKWKRKQEDLTSELEAQKNKEISEMKMKFVQEKNLEKAQLAKDNHRAIDILRKEHKRELDSLVRKFSNVAADLERLKKCTAELEDTKAELAATKERYDETCQQLANITRTLTDTKMKLMTFEEQFDTKVQEVDEKYKKRIDNLMTQNTELKRLYVSKCGELYDEKLLVEKDRVERVTTARETMQKLLASKHKAEVNLTTGMPETENVERVPKSRPGSAPSTKREARSAISSAGQLDHLKQADVENTRPEVILPEDSAEIEEMRRMLMEDIKDMTKEELLKTISDSVS